MKSESTEKLSFREWCEHVWYYNKWMIILGGCVVLFFVIGFIQILTRNEGDVSLLYTGKSTITVKGTTALKETVISLIDDYNDDGVIAVDYLELTAMTTRDTSGVVFDADTNNTVLKRFESEIRVGDSVIYLLDEYYFNHVVDIGIVEKLSDVLLEQEMPDDMVNEYGVYIKDLNIHSAPGFNQLPGNTVLCIRRSPQKDEIGYGRNIEVYTANKLLFKKLITYNS